MAKALLGIALSLCLGISVAQAQTSKQNPAWGQLTQEQQRILAPIQGEWDKFEPERKRRWISIAQRYPKMKPEEQARLQRRMREWVSLTPEQRSAAREKYKEFEQLPASDRQVARKKWEEYKQARAAEEAQMAADPVVEKDTVVEKTAETAGEKPDESAAATESRTPEAPGAQPQ